VRNSAEARRWYRDSAEIPSTKGELTSLYFAVREGRRLAIEEILAVLVNNKTTDMNQFVSLAVLTQAWSIAKANGQTDIAELIQYWIRRSKVMNAASISYERQEKARMDETHFRMIPPLYAFYDEIRSGFSSQLAAYKILKSGLVARGATPVETLISILSNTAGNIGGTVVGGMGGAVIGGAAGSVVPALVGAVVDRYIQVQIDEIDNIGITRKFSDIDQFSEEMARRLTYLYKLQLRIVSEPNAKKVATKAVDRMIDCLSKKKDSHWKTKGIRKDYDTLKRFVFEELFCSLAKSSDTTLHLTGIRFGDASKEDCPGETLGAGLNLGIIDAREYDRKFAQRLALKIEAIPASGHCCFQ